MNPRISELEIQGKCRVKVHSMTTWPACACTVNLRRVVAMREPAAVLLSNLVLMLKEVKEMQGKCSVNWGWDSKSLKCSISLSYVRFCKHDWFHACGLGMVNVIRISCLSEFSIFPHGQRGLDNQGILVGLYFCFLYYFIELCNRNKEIPFSFWMPKTKEIESFSFVSTLLLQH